MYPQDVWRYLTPAILYICSVDMCFFPPVRTKEKYLVGSSVSCCRISTKRHTGMVCKMNNALLSHAGVLQTAETQLESSGTVFGFIFFSVALPK